MQRNFLLSILVLLLFISACSDDATVVKSKNIKRPLECLRLVVFPPDKLLSETLNKLYKFDNNCSYTLEASRKSGIVCNSNQNAPQKALSNFPNSFIRFDIYEKRKNIYSYYKDLTHCADKSDIENAFQRVQKDLL